MTERLRIALGQLNLLVGDLDGNRQQLRDATRRARDQLKAHAVILPELATTGYPPEDLLLRPGFLRDATDSLDRLMAEAQGIDVMVGHPWLNEGRLYNALSVLRDGKRSATYCKHCLPNYGVFDEKRYFESGTVSCVHAIHGFRTGLLICEDIWEPGPARRLVQDLGAELIVVINASPYHREKGRERERMVAERARENGVAIVYLNLVGGQDELVFDGGSFVVAADGKLALRCPGFESGLYLAEFERRDGRVVPVTQVVASPPPVEEEVYRALVLGVRDYIGKNRFAGAVIGLSGGIDSALTLCIAVDAIGADRVEAVMMPSRYTADMSVEDARAQAQALGVASRIIPIETMFNAFNDALREEFRGLPADATEENLQARTRGMLLMAISNKTGRMVITTGNKSEMSVGYATLYGDMAGGFAAIKDVPKTLVYRIAKYRNSVGSVIPARVFERAPSAELRPDQKDTDSLPPYDILDPILERYVERDQSAAEIVAAGFEARTVERVIAMVDSNEYKRRQAPPGVRITPRAFGRDRRYPITSGYGRPGKR
ncbi:MAG: NAD+ synthase [Pseudomonadota bacterium]